MRSAISSSSAIANVSVVAGIATHQARCFASSPRLLQGEKIFLSKYKTETFKHIEAMKKNTTYPGAIRAATPGDTTHHHRGHAIKLDPRERQYWRPVVDDLYVEDKMTLRVRFKDDVWVTTRWESRMHTVEVSLPRNATIADLVREVTISNRHPHLCRNPFVIAHEDKILPMTASVEECGIDELSALHAIDTDRDHIAHLPEGQLKDPNVDEITEADIKDVNARYRDIGMHSSEGNARGRPSYQATPSKIFNFGRF